MAFTFTKAPSPSQIYAISKDLLHKGILIFEGRELFSGNFYEIHTVLKFESSNIMSKCIILDTIK